MEYVTVKKSSAGLGLFATTEIRGGQQIIEYIGKRITSAAADEKGGKYLFELNDDWTLDGSSRSNTARYANHSCDPNAYAELTADERQVFIIAKENIAPGEEITIDYGKSYFDIEIAPVGCRCKKCLTESS